MTKTIFRLVLAVTTVGISTGLQAQDQALPSIIMPSPDASAMIKATNIPVDHSTGIPNIQVPLFSLPSKDGLQAGASLNYHASGIKVSERSSVVGAGWNLAAGGAITRVVQGNPDWVDAGDLCDNSILSTTYPPGCDLAPDVFYYNFLGRSGRFYLDETAKCHLQPYQNVNISFSTHPYNFGTEQEPNNDYSFFNWRITDENGYTFVFGNTLESIEITKLLVNGNQKSNYESTWYLTKVLNPANEEVFTLDYVSGGELEIESKSQSMTKIIYEESNPTIYQTSNENFTSTDYKNVTYPVFLSSIGSSFGEIRFFYANDRQDLTNGRRLNSVSLRDEQGYSVCSYYLYQDYFNGWNSRHLAGDVSTHNFYDQTYIDQQNWDPNNPYTVNDLPVRRLKLDRITKACKFFPQANEKMYRSFNYNVETGLPDYNSEYQDHYGYYNGGNADRASTINDWYRSNVSLENFDPEKENLLPDIFIKPDATYTSQECGYTNQMTHNPWSASCTGGSSVIRKFNSPGKRSNFEDVKANILEEIHFPTGGYQKIIYESSGFNAAAIRVAEIAHYDENDVQIASREYSYGNPVTFGKPVYHRNFKHSQGGETVLISSQSFTNFLDFNGSPIRYGNVGVYTPEGTNVEYEYSVHNDVSPDFEHVYTPTNNYPEYGVSVFAPSTTQFWKRGLLEKVSYYKNDRESSKLLASTSYAYNYDIATVNETTGYSFYYSGSYSDSRHGHVGQYDYISQPVTLSRKIEKTYDKENDNYESVQTNYVYDPTTLQLTKTEVVSDGYPTYSSEYKYATDADYDFENPELQACINDLSNCEADCANDAYYDGIDYGECSDDCRVIYDQCVANMTINISEQADALQRMRQRHMINVLIEQKNWMKEDGTSKLMSANLTTYGLEGTGNQYIRPQEAFVIDGLRTDYSSSNDSYVDANGNLLKSSHFRKVKTFDTYNQTSGQLLSETDLSGITTGYEWDTNDNYLLATVVNGQRSETTYQSLVGKATETDANGHVTTYVYDDQNRLKQIKVNGDIVKQYSYQLIDEN